MATTKQNKVKSKRVALKREPIALKNYETVLFIRAVPPELKGHFKAACSLRNRSMTVVIVEFMRRYVADTHGDKNIKSSAPHIRRRKRKPLPQED